VWHRAYIPQINISRFDPTAVAYNNLQPLSTHQFLLTVTNPLYDPINITLATPERTPGKHPSTVYILCPEFEVGAATDVWDEALGGGAQQPKQKSKGKKSGVVGTVWETGRNWTTVIIEVVPPMIPEEEEDEEAKVVKIPILVRSVYEAEVDRVDAGLGAGVGGKELREKKEHSYWSVIEVGRVGSRVRRVEAEVEGGRTAESGLGRSR
jgi:dynactin-4